MFSAAALTYCTLSVSSRTITAVASRSSPGNVSIVIRSPRRTAAKSAPPVRQSSRSPPRSLEIRKLLSQALYVHLVLLHPLLKWLQTLEHALVVALIPLADRLLFRQLLLRHR